MKVHTLYWSSEGEDALERAAAIVDVSQVKIRGKGRRRDRRGYRLQQDLLIR